MRATVRTALVLSLLLLGNPGRADSAKEARALLDRAIAAMGGKEKLSRSQAATWKGKGKIHAGEQRIDFTDEWSVQGLAQYRWSIEATAMGRTQSLLLVLNKDQGWARNDGEAQDLSKQKEILTLLQTELRTIRLAQTLVPMTEKGYQLSHLGELKIQDRPAVGIKVVRKGQADIDLFFDKTTSLPLRSEVHLKEPESDGEVLHAVSYDKYEEIDGVKHFTQLELRRDDKVLIEMELSDFQLPEQLGEETFARP
jgi:hypothetical protein